jgi:hypothetical protein
MPKKTDLLAVELEVISETIVGDYRQQVLKEAAERLRDLEGIAKLYHAEASRLAMNIKGRRVAKRHEGIE